MRYLLLITTFILLGFSAKPQESNKILRFEVKSTLLKVPLENGSLSEWRSFGNVDETMQTKIVFDFTRKKIFWDTKAKNNDKDYEGGIQVMDINTIITDTTYTDFGFTCFKLNCTDEKKKIKNYELIEFNFKNCQQVYLIENSNKLKTKLELVLK